MLRLPGECIAFVPMHRSREREPVYSESDITIKSNRHVFLCGRTQRSAPTRRICFKKQSHVIRKRICHVHQTHIETALQRDARWNVERVGRKPDTPQCGGCKPGRMRRLAGRAPSKMVNSTTASRIPKSHHRGWSTHLASRRDRLAQPDHTYNRSFVTPGGIGTHGIHPPRKRTSINVKAHTANQNRYTWADTPVRPYAEDLFR